VRPRLLTVEQAAVYIGRTKDAVHHMIASSKLPTVRSDRRVFIDMRDLDSWIEENKQRGLV
jgi:excisionase family DNA binding protein